MGIVSQYGLSFYTIDTGLSMDFFVFIHFLFAQFTKTPGLFQRARFIFYSYFPLPLPYPFVVGWIPRPLQRKKLPCRELLSFLKSFWKRKVLLKAQQIISRNIKKHAQRPDILHTGFIPVIFQIGDFPLRHIYSFTQFCLIQLPFFSQEFDLFSEGQIHFHHRAYFTIDANFLFIFRY